MNLAREESFADDTRIIKDTQYITERTATETNSTTFGYTLFRKSTVDAQSIFN